MDKRPQPRWLQHLWANLRGYWWAPCPICGEPFGAHEIGGAWYRTPTTGSCVCRNCAQIAQEISVRNQILYGYEDFRITGGRHG